MRARRETADEKHNRRARNYQTHLFRYARRRALKLGIPFTITLDDVPIPTHCPVLGIALGMQRHLKGRSNYAGASIDRIDCLMGYVPGNVVVVSNRVNTLKSNAALHELIAIAQFYSRFL